MPSVCHDSRVTCSAKSLADMGTDINADVAISDIGADIDADVIDRLVDGLIGFKGVGSNKATTNATLIWVWTQSLTLVVVFLPIGWCGRIDDGTSPCVITGKDACTPKVT